MKLLIDPACGGDTYGNVTPLMVEKDVNLKTALRLRSLLEADFLVELTRHADDQVSHTERARLAAEADVTVSIRYYGSPNPYIHAVESSARTEAGEAMARCVLDHLRRATGEPGRYRSTNCRITHGPKPAIIVVGGYLTNPPTERAIVSGERIDQVATGVRDGLLAAVGRYRPASRSVEAGTTLG